MVTIWGDGGVIGVPAALRFVTVSVMIPATVPVASTGEFVKTALVVPALTTKLAVLDPPPDVMN